MARDAARFPSPGAARRDIPVRGALQRSRAGAVRSRRRCAGCARCSSRRRVSADGVLPYGRGSRPTDATPGPNRRPLSSPPCSPAVKPVRGFSHSTARVVVPFGSGLRDHPDDLRVALAELRSRNTLAERRARNVPLIRLAESRSTKIDEGVVRPSAFEKPRGARLNLPWNQQAAYDRGSFATLLGVSLDWTLRRARLTAVGDSVGFTAARAAANAAGLLPAL